jgi:hypothetical protein
MDAEAGHPMKRAHAAKALRRAVSLTGMLVSKAHNEAQAMLIRTELAYENENRRLRAQIEKSGPLAVAEAQLMGRKQAVAEVTEAFLQIDQILEKNGGRWALLIQEFRPTPLAKYLVCPDVQVCPGQQPVILNRANLLAVWTMLARCAKDLPSPALGRRNEVLHFPNRPDVVVLEA